jgi:Tetratricopeptide repeat/Peptidase_C39 like family
MRLIHTRLFVVAALFLAAGCASYPAAGFKPGAPARAVPDTPFYPQTRYQCGPAALQSVLDYSGARSTMAALVERVYLPDRQGSLQAEMLAAARAAGRIPYRVDPSLDAILDELGAGRPVLVLQNLGISWAPRWHYAVIYAVDPESGIIWLRSGTEPERQTPAPVFLRTWARADFWALVVLRPGELPANPDPERFLAALVAMDATGNPDAALPSWRSARAMWPNLPLPLFALGNAALAAGDAADAESLFRRLLEIQPRHAAARNNLAHALAAQGQTEAAIAELGLALSQPDLTEGLRRELEDSLAGIAHASGRP